jgi:hypothetical protein
MNTPSKRSKATEGVSREAIAREAAFKFCNNHPQARLIEDDLRQAFQCAIDEATNELNVELTLARRSRDLLYAESRAAQPQQEWTEETVIEILMSQLSGGIAAIADAHNATLT